MNPGLIANPGAASALSEVPRWRLRSSGLEAMLWRSEAFLNLTRQLVQEFPVSAELLQLIHDCLRSAILAEDDAMMKMFCDLIPGDQQENARESLALRIPMLDFDAERVIAGAQPLPGAAAASFAEFGPLGFAGLCAWLRFAAAFVHAVPGDAEELEALLNPEWLEGGAEVTRYALVLAMKLLGYAEQAGRELTPAGQAFMEVFYERRSSQDFPRMNRLMMLAGRGTLDEDPLVYLAVPRRVVLELEAAGNAAGLWD
jgi:hypothetical protein